MSTIKVNNIVPNSTTHVSGAFTGTFSGSIENARLDRLESFSSSLDAAFATDAQLTSLSASLATRINAATNEQDLSGLATKVALNTFTASYVTDSASFADRIDNAGGGGGATLSSNVFTGSQYVSGGLFVEEYSKFGKSGIAKALDIFGAISVTSSVTTQVNSIGGFVGNYYRQWDSFGSQGGDGNASVGYFVGAANDDRKLRLTSDSDIQLNHGIGKKIQVPRTLLGESKLELSGSLAISSSVTQNWYLPKISVYNPNASNAVTFELNKYDSGLGGYYNFTIRNNGDMANGTWMSNGGLPIKIMTNTIQLSGQNETAGETNVIGNLRVTGSLLVSSSFPSRVNFNTYQVKVESNGENYITLSSPNNSFEIYNTNSGGSTGGTWLTSGKPVRHMAPILQLSEINGDPGIVNVIGKLNVTGSMGISGSIIPAIGNGTSVSSFNLGSPTAAWKDIYVSNGTIYFLNASGVQQGTLSTTSDGIQTSGDIFVHSNIRVGRGPGNNSLNTAFGMGALQSNTSGSQNTAFGQTSLVGNTTGVLNTAIGQGSLAFNTSGNYNTAVGQGSLYLNNGNQNTAVGVRAGTSVTDGYSNVIIGYETLRGLTDGANNVAIGAQAGYYATGSSTNNIFIGPDAGPASNQEVNNKLYIHIDSEDFPLIFGDFQQREVTINHTLNVSGSGMNPGQLNVYGSTDLYGTLNVSGSIIPAIGGSATSSFSLGSATNAWKDIWVSQGTIHFLDGAGVSQGTLSTTANGIQSDGDIYVNSNVRVGKGPGNNGLNTVFGAGALQSNTSGSNNTAFGGGALSSNTTGDLNTAIGLSSMAFNSTGYYNTAVGQTSLYSNETGIANTAVGVRAGDSIRTGNNNVIMGYETLHNITNGTGNTAIGYQAGTFASGSSGQNIYLGYQAGPTASITENNKLYIDFYRTDKPLIGGDFQQRQVVVNGMLNVTTFLTLPPQNPLPVNPSPTLGSMAVSGSSLYFYNGSAWKEVSLVP